MEAEEEASYINIMGWSVQLVNLIEEETRMYGRF